MKAEVQKINPVAFCFLILAVVGLNAHPALAQTNEACPATPGVVPIGDPSVTAQQVENGNATLQSLYARSANGLQGCGCSRSGDRTPFWMPYQARRGTLAFRFYLPSATGTKRQGVPSREEHGVVGQPPENLGFLQQFFVRLGVSPVDLTNPIAVRNGLLAEPIASFNAPALGASGHASAYEGRRGSDHTARRIRPQRIPLGPRTNRLRRSDHSRPRRGGPQNLEGLRRERDRAI